MSGWVGRVLLVVLLSSVVVVGTSSGQDSRRNPLAPGVWALQFGISPNFTLTTFNGATIAVKRQSSPRTALRVGLTLNVQSSDDEATADTLYHAEQNRDSYGASLNVDWLRYLRPEARWSFYVGLGPSARWSHSTTNYNYTFLANGEVRATSTRDTGWGAGVNGVFGGEWFVSQAIGLHAEYRLEAGYSSVTGHTTDTRSGQSQPPLDFETEGHSDSWYVGPGFVRFGLSAYF